MKYDKGSGRYIENPHRESTRLFDVGLFARGKNRKYTTNHRLGMRSRSGKEEKIFQPDIDPLFQGDSECDKKSPPVLFKNFKNLLSLVPNSISL